MATTDITGMGHPEEEALVVEVVVEEDGATTTTTTLTDDAIVDRAHGVMGDVAAGANTIPPRPIIVIDLPASASETTTKTTPLIVRSGCAYYTPTRRPRRRNRGRTAKS
jgi:hypothetical protein